MRKDPWKVLGAFVVMLVALGQPAPASAADEPTCAQGYILCLNDATQVSGWWERTTAEAGCLRAYGSCLKHQAFGL